MHTQVWGPGLLVFKSCIGDIVAIYSNYYEIVAICHTNVKHQIKIFGTGAAGVFWH